VAPVETASVLGVNAVAVVLLGWTTWAAAQSREQPSAEPFIALLATLTLWVACSLGSELPLVSTVSLLSTVLNLTQFGAALVLPGIWIIYALSYTGRGTGLTWRRIALLGGIAVPVVISGVVLAVGESETAVLRAIAPLIGTEILYLFGLFVYATYLLVDLGGSHPRVSNTQVVVLTAGVAAPYLTSLVGNNTALVGSTTLGLLLSGGILAVVVRRYPVMTGFPKADHVARTRVVETLQEALVVLDWDDHVLDVNEATAALFDRSATTMIGEPIRSVIDGLDDTEFPAGTTGTVALQTSKGRRQFQFSVSTVDESTSGDEDNPVARTVIFRDVTDRRTREQRLTVLNRILRHNVRNDLDVVLAYADHVDDDELRAGIREQTSDLLELSTKVRDAEAVMTATTEPPEPIDLTDVAETVVAEARADDGASDLSLVRPDELPITTHRSVVQRCLAELVENALVHAGEAPDVEVRVREAPDGGAELVVADDGPGVPERERAIIEDGTESQLEHGHGIGLWFVNWAVTQLGGELQIRRPESKGTTVRIHLYETTN
jgi:signal transduction histidine kinase